MNQFNLKTVCVMSIGAALTAAPLASAHAANRCDMPHVGPEAKACAIAAQGPTELRRFVERTRSIYGLYYWNYAQPEKETLGRGPASNLPTIAQSRSDRGAPMQ